MRGKDVGHPMVQREKAEIVEAIEIESREEGSWMDLLRDGGVAANKRFFLALGIQFKQQMSGKFISSGQESSLSIHPFSW